LPIDAPDRFVNEHDLMAWLDREFGPTPPQPTEQEQALAEVIRLLDKLSADACEGAEARQESIDRQGDTGA
jgi:hypothetical protein